MREWLTPILLVLAFTFAVALAGPTVDELSHFADGDAAAIFRPDPGITLDQLGEMRKEASRQGHLMFRVHEIGSWRCAWTSGFLDDCGSSIKKADSSKEYEYLRHGAYQSQDWREVWTDYPERGGELVTRMIRHVEAEGAQARDLPASPEVWEACCSHGDCRLARIDSYQLDDTWTVVKINDMEPFKIESSKVLPSKNGKAYYCRISPFHRLDGKNIRCVFIVGRLA